MTAADDEWIPMLRPGVLDGIADFKRTVTRPDTASPIRSPCSEATWPPTPERAWTAACSGRVPLASRR